MIQDFANWLFEGKGTVLLGLILFASGCFMLLGGVLFTLQGLGFFKEITK
jgi:hypothetical protein